MKKLTKSANITDLHFGAKNSSEAHNQDILDFLTWFCSHVKKDKSIDHIVMLGDWHEVRANISISTLNYSYQGAKMLNDLGMPVFFLLGNHDLHHRHNREVYSTVTFNEFDNFRVISEPTVVSEISNGALMCPFLFHDEYAALAQYTDIPIWYGHFEFKDFVVTGTHVKMQHGPDASVFANQKRIFSGHFHKRQTIGNVTYIGNIFPTSFADANDTKRGFMVYDYEDDFAKFYDWKDCPKYTKVKLSEFIDGKLTIDDKTRLKCVVDIPITFEESLVIKEAIVTRHNPVDLVLEESMDADDALSQDAIELDDISGVDELVAEMIKSIESKNINSDLLLSIYKELEA